MGPNPFNDVPICDFPPNQLVKIAESLKMFSDRHHISAEKCIVHLEH
jgi:hypothetical protein